MRCHKFACKYRTDNLGLCELDIIEHPDAEYMGECDFQTYYNDDGFPDFDKCRHSSYVSCQVHCYRYSACDET